MAMDQNNLWTGFQMPRRLAADTETLTERYGRFSAQPFERGFGTTIGNSLRRALLSSIEGAAITAVKIEGVEHEFSSIKGVVEDATEVLRGQRLLAWAEMARMIAHEIKNPLTPIRLSTEHMMEVYKHDPEHFNRVFERCTNNILSQVEELRSIASPVAARR